MKRKVRTFVRCIEIQSVQANGRNRTRDHVDGKVAASLEDLVR